MSASCYYYGKNYPWRDKGHRAKSLTLDNRFSGHAVNNTNAMVEISHQIGKERAILLVTAGISMYSFTVLGGLMAGDGVVITRPNPKDLLDVDRAKALGVSQTIFARTGDNRLQIGTMLNADHVMKQR